VSTTNEALFDQIVAATRLNALVAPFTVRRVLIRSGFNPDDVAPDQLREALPRFGDALAVYLRDEDLEQALRDLEALARGGQPAAPS
jgi:hypothetical protein